MKYENADNIFPDKLLLEIRKYMPEGYVYIPAGNSRKEWGSISGQKEELKRRNSEIYHDYQGGKTIEDIARENYLSKSSVYRIIKQYKCI